MPRFYAPGLEPSDETVALPDEEAQHLVRVLRLERGDSVDVFNGRGYACRATIELADKRGAVLRVLEPTRAADELPLPVTLAQAVLKGEKMDDLVRDAVMLGVTRVQPLITHHVDVPLAHIQRAARVERWRRVAVSSTKQCGRAVVPSLGEPLTLRDVLAGTAAGLCLMLVEPRASAAVRTVREVVAVGRPDVLTVLAGPEGGWSPDEIAAAQAAGATLVSLGARTIRADAIALVALPILLYAFGALE